MPTSTQIRIGVGGWSYEPWRGAFYPKGLPQRQELEYASRKLTSIEIDSTYYGSKKPESFSKWRDETPDDFVFSVKGPRFATNRRVLAEAGPSIERFFKSGVTELKASSARSTGSSRRPSGSTRTTSALPRAPAPLGRRTRDPPRGRGPPRQFRTPDFVALAREHGVAVVIAGDSKFPQIADVTAPFVYARIMGTTEARSAGYPSEALDLWAKRAKAWAAAARPTDLETVAPPPKAPRARRLSLCHQRLQGAKPAPRRWR